MADFNSGKNIFVVLQLQKVEDKKRAFSMLQEKAQELFGLGRYAYILHDKDVLETGELKGPHIHVVLCAEKAKSSQSWIKHFSSLLDLEPEAVSVEMQGSERKCIRYLLHLDDGAKHQYDRSEVVTNMDSVCKKAWEANSAFVSNPSLEQLQEAYKQGAKGLYNLVGLTAFEKARKVVELFKVEDERETFYINQVADLCDRLAEVTANRDYLRTGSVPLKDFQHILDDCCDTLQRMIKRRKAIQDKLKLDKDD